MKSLSDPNRALTRIPRVRGRIPVRQQPIPDRPYRVPSPQDGSIKDTPPMKRRLLLRVILGLSILAVLPPVSASATRPQGRTADPVVRLLVKFKAGTTTRAANATL